MRLSKLQKWTLNRICQECWLCRRGVKRFYGKETTGGWRMQDPMTPAQRVTIHRSLNRLFASGLIEFDDELRESYVLTPAGIKALVKTNGSRDGAETVSFNGYQARLEAKRAEFNKWIETTKVLLAARFGRR